MPRPKKAPDASLAALLGSMAPPSAAPVPVGDGIEEEPPLGAPDDSPAPEPTVAIANLPEDEVVLPGFLMTDDPDDLPDTIVGNAALVRDPDGNPPSNDAPALHGEIMPPMTNRPQSGVRYESRIRILEVFQYPGQLKDAPDWVDKSWTGYGDWDPVRNIQPGPALRVPGRDGEVVLARPGDYVCRQEIVLAHGVEPDVRVEVWSRESFEKNFIPEPRDAAAKQLRPGPPTSTPRPEQSIQSGAESSA